MTINKLQQMEILLGDDADSFFKSDLGQYVVAKAQQVCDDALVGLRIVDPEDTKKIRELQNQISIAEGTLGWLQEMLITGRQTLETLQENQ